MMRTAISAFALLAVLGGPALAQSTAAAPKRHHRAGGAAMTVDRAAAPLAPRPVLADADGLQAAPLPNLDVAPPIDPGHTDTTVEPSVFKLHYPPVGNGYTYGSSSESIDDVSTAKVPGVELTSPLN